MPSKDRKTPAPRLSDMEWEVKKPLWKQGPMAARDIYESVPDSFGWAYETVKTMLARLVKKGVLIYDQVGNSYLYSPMFTRSEMMLSCAPPSARLVLRYWPERRKS